jgi:cyclic pyranopterin phosphate synthase
VYLFGKSLSCLRCAFPYQTYNLRKVTVMIYDKCNRPVLNLRLSVIQKCDKHCPYCHREGENEPIKLMSVAEIIRIVRVALSLGINRVKLTGGEPLLRKNIVEIVKGIADLKGLNDLSMTTNGTHLKNLAKDLRKSGLKRVNVSLPTLNPLVYKQIMGGNLQDAIDGINTAVAVGMNPVKLNMLVLKNVNDNEIDQMIEFAIKTNTILQLIELEPINLSEDYYKNHHIELDKIENKIKKLALEIRVRKFMQKRRVYKLQNVKIELIRPIENTEFCGSCTRLRITSDGKIKPCLMRTDNLVDLLSPMQEGANDDMLKGLFREAISNREPYYKKIRSKNLN